MSDEPSRPGQLPKRQLAALKSYLSEEVYPYCDLHRRALDRAGLLRGRIGSLSDLRRLTPVTLEDVGAGAKHLLEPSPDAVRASGSLELRFRAAVASSLGRRPEFARSELDPRYKPVLWTREGVLRTGWSSHDLDRLGDLGRRLLERAGVRPDDRMLVIGLAVDTVAFWQLSLGARAGGVSTMHLDDAETDPLTDGRVTVVAGGFETLSGLFDGSSNDVKTLVVVGPPHSQDDREELARAAGASVVQAWAPPGVRTLWSEIRGKPGFITAADAEVIEVVDGDDRPVRDGQDGELIWTSLGWAGTVILRLRTGVLASKRVAPSGRGGQAIELREPLPVTP